MTAEQPVVADAGSDGQRFRERLRGESVAGPDLLRVEVASVLRRHAGNGNLTERQADSWSRCVIEVVRPRPGDLRQ